MIRNPFLMVSRIGRNGAVCQGEKICRIGRALSTNCTLITSPQYLSDCGCGRPNCRIVSVEDSPDSFVFATIACSMLATWRNGEATTSKRSWARKGLDSAQFRSGEVFFLLTSPLMGDPCAFSQYRNPNSHNGTTLPKPTSMSSLTTKPLSASLT